MSTNKRFEKNTIENLIFEYGNLYKAEASENKEFNSNNISVFIMGSQSIWGTIEAPNRKLLTSSDLDCLPDIDLMKEMGIDFDNFEQRVAFCIGEGTQKAEAYNGKFLDVVSENTVHAPVNWKERVKEKTYNLDEKTIITASFLDKHDLVIAKMIAGRSKDLDYVKTLINDNSISIKKINKLLNSTEVEEPIKRKLLEYPNLNSNENSVLNFKKNIANKLNHFIQESFLNNRNKGQPLKKIKIKDDCLIDYNQSYEIPNGCISPVRQKLENKLNVNIKNSFKPKINNKIK